MADQLPILILAGFAAGLAMATGDFHADRLLQNAWFRLGLVGLGVAAIVVAGAFLQQRIVRRVQLCVVISLLVHLALGVVLHEHYLTAVAHRHDTSTVEQRTQPERPTPVPEFQWEHVERPPSRHVFEEPLETDSPKPSDPELMEPQPIAFELPPDRKPTVEPEPPRPEQPKAAELRRAGPKPPRRTELAAAAQISRQLWRQMLLPEAPIAQARRAPRNEEPTARPQAMVAGPEQRQDEVALHQPRVFDRLPSTTRRRPVTELARRTSPTSRAESVDAHAPTEGEPAGRVGGRRNETAQADPRADARLNPVEAPRSQLAYRSAETLPSRLRLQDNARASGGPLIAKRLPGYRRRPSLGIGSRNSETHGARLRKARRSRRPRRCRWRQCRPRPDSPRRATAQAPRPGPIRATAAMGVTRAASQSPSADRRLCRPTWWRWLPLQAGCRHALESPNRGLTTGLCWRRRARRPNGLASIRWGSRWTGDGDGNARTGR